MKKVVFLNGKYLPEDKAYISVFDRGFLLADGVYEVVPVIRGKLVDVEQFLERFDRSLSALKLPWPMRSEKCLSVFKELIELNRLEEGGIYAQLTRGVAPRIFEFPKNLSPTCMAYTFEKNIIQNHHARTGVSVATVDDIRWRRRDIKSIALLGQSLAKEEAIQHGVYEGWMVENGHITEGTASSAYIVKGNTIITRPLTNSILPGIRRQRILEFAAQENIPVELRAFTPQEAYGADEAFLSSATTLIYPIIKIDEHVIGNGRPGIITQKLRKIYIRDVLDI